MYEGRTEQSAALHQPPSQAAFGFRTAEATLAVIGDGDKNREARGMG
jgi:hypothetical protein